MSANQNAPLDPDFYGMLGMGLWHAGTLAHYPDLEPSVHRGPLYPLFIAGLLALSNGWWPYCVQVAQALLLGLTSLLAWWMSQRLWSKTVALAVTLFCAFHPFLIWYTSRIWIETLATTLLTGLMAGLLALELRPTATRSAAVGVLLGLLSLCKQTFLPLVVVVPVMLSIVKRDKRVTVGKRLMILCIALIMIVPWSLRNWALTGTFIPVHSLTGFNFVMGDTFVDQNVVVTLEHRAAYEAGWAIIAAREASLAMSPALPLAQREVLRDSALLQDSLARYAHDPAFLVKKIGVNSILFWALGDSASRTRLLMVLQLPIVALFAGSAVLIGREHGLRAYRFIPVVLVLCFFVSHLPIIAFARLSVVLLPTMAAYGFGLVARAVRRREPSGEVERLGAVP